MLACMASKLELCNYSFNCRVTILIKRFHPVTWKCEVISSVDYGMWIGQLILNSDQANFGGISQLREAESLLTTSRRE